MSLHQIISVISKVLTDSKITKTHKYIHQANKYIKEHGGGGGGDFSINFSKTLALVLLKYSKTNSFTIFFPPKLRFIIYRHMYSPLCHDHITTLDVHYFLIIQQPTVLSPMEFWFLAAVASGLLSWGHLISSDIVDLIEQKLFELNWAGRCHHWIQ